MAEISTHCNSRASVNFLLPSAPFFLPLLQVAVPTFKAFRRWIGLGRIRVFTMTAPIKHGRAVGRFGDYLCVDCANLPYVGGHNQFKNSNFARPNTKIPKSTRQSVSRSAFRPFDSNLAIYLRNKQQLDSTPSLLDVGKICYLIILLQSAGGGMALVDFHI